METKQISNYLVKLDGFTSDPDKSHSAKVTELASEMQVHMKKFYRRSEISGGWVWGQCRVSTEQEEVRSGRKGGEEHRYPHCVTVKVS